MDQIIGKCSLCGGIVVMPDVRLSTEQPRPMCQDCGARATQQVPTVAMERPDRAEWSKQLKTRNGAKA